MTRTILLLIVILMTYQVMAQTCEAPKTEVLDSKFAVTINEINVVVKKDFKKRKATLSNYKPLLNISTNFKVPIFGKDNYFGNIYLVKGQPGIVKYRDELIAERRYKEEVNNEKFYVSEYKTSEINSPSGLSLIKKAGAEVRLTSSNFSTTTGGSLKLKVKGPGDNPRYLQIDVDISNGNAHNYLVIGTARFAFDTMKINAEKSFLSGTSILNGIDNVEFSFKGKVVQVIKIEDQ